MKALDDLVLDELVILNYNSGKDLQVLLSD